MTSSEIPITQPPTLRGTARVVSGVTAKPRVTLGLRALTHLYGVIIYLALGYEVLRRRNPPRNAYVGNGVITYAALT